jgi:hypothetical protein
MALGNTEAIPVEEEQEGEFITPTKRRANKLSAKLPR